MKLRSRPSRFRVKRGSLDPVAKTGNEYELDRLTRANGDGAGRTAKSQFCSRGLPPSPLAPVKLIFRNPGHESRRSPVGFIVGG